MLMLISGSGCGNSEPEVYTTISENITWQIDDTTVYGTITRPDNGKKHPAVVFIAGSGPTDRNWNSPLLPGTNGSAGLLAEELAKDGFVTLRYDKRVSGPHVAETLPLLMGKISMQSHLDEVRGAVETLLAREDVDDSRIFVLANSEGTIHAVNYQLDPDGGKLAGLILTGTPGRTIGDVSRSQIEAQLEGYPGGDATLEAYDVAIASFTANGTIEPDASLPQGITNLLLSLTAPANLPFTRELWAHDITQNLQDIQVPVLNVIGKKDIQIDWQVDGAYLKQSVAGNDNFTFSYPDNANHILKYEESAIEEINASALDYNSADSVLDAETLKIIKQWLDDHT